MKLLQFRFCWAVGLALVQGSSAEDWAWQDAFIQTQPDGSHRIRLVGKSTAVTTNDRPFRVISASAWLADVVPLFEIEREGRYELRRRPMSGRENVTDPLFFALPPNQEPDAGRLAGRWQIQSTNQHGGRNWTFFELTTLGEKVVGRFDQNTDYRFGFVTGGVWRSNLLTLQVEYIQDRYQLDATWSDEKLIGTWKRTDDSDHGRWSGTRARPDPPLPLDLRTLDLWEWRHPEDRGRRFTLDTNSPTAWVGWQRSAEPLCRVWLPE